MALAGAALGTVRSAVVLVDPGDTTPIAAKCPRGTLTEAGGFRAEHDPAGNDASLLVLDSVPVKRRSWRTAAYNDDNDDSGLLDSYAYCVRRLPGRIVQTGTNQVDGGTLGAAKARCPRGTHVLSGGFVTESDSLIPVTSMRAGSRSWKVKAFNGEMGDFGLRAVAVCADAPPLAERTREAEATGNTPEVLKPRCPEGTRAVSGGYDGHLALKPSASGTVTFVSRRAPGRRWRVEAANASAVLDATITAYAYCG